MKFLGLLALAVLAMVFLPDLRNTAFDLLGSALHALLVAALHRAAG